MWTRSELWARARQSYKLAIASLDLSRSQALPANSFAVSCVAHSHKPVLCLVPPRATLASASRSHSNAYLFFVIPRPSNNNRSA